MQHLKGKEMQKIWYMVTWKISVFTSERAFSACSIWIFRRRRLSRTVQPLSKNKSVRPSLLSRVQRWEISSVNANVNSGCQGWSHKYTWKHAFANAPLDFLLLQVPAAAVDSKLSAKKRSSSKVSIYILPSKTFVLLPMTALVNIFGSYPRATIHLNQVRLSWC